MSSYATGRTYEQELVNRFKEAGWGALRLGASGGGGEADLPDVLTGRQPTYHDFGWDDAWNMPPVPVSMLYSIELKSGKADILYVEPEEVDALKRFSERFGATAYLGVRSTQQATPTETFLVAPEDARRTDSGRYAVDVRDAGERAGVVVGRAGEVRVGDGP